MSAPALAAARRARVATSLGFAVQGLVYALLLTSLPTFEERYGVDEGPITLVILGVCAMAAIGTGIADRCARTDGGSRLALSAGLATVAVAVVAISAAPTFLLLAAAFGLYGLGLGLVDAGTNMQAVAVQRAYGRSLLTGFYASWSAGGIVGALVISATADRTPVEPVTVVLLLGTLVAAVVAVLVARDGWRGHDAPVAPTEKPSSVVPWGAVFVLGLGVVAYYVADSAVSTWSTTFMRDAVDATARLAPLGYAAYLATTLGSRLAGDPLVRRWGRAVVVRWAALTGAAGLLAVVLAPGAGVALVGFAVAGAGLGVIAPLCFSAAGALTPEHADAVVARLNVFNYVGAVLGGVLVGAIGSASTMRVGFVVPILLVVAVAVVAHRFGGKGTGGTGPAAPQAAGASDPTVAVANDAA